MNDELNEIYEKLALHIGKLYSVMQRANGAFDGEHTIQHVGEHGRANVIHVHIDGNDFQLYSEPGNVGLSADARMHKE